MHRQDSPGPGALGGRCEGLAQTPGGGWWQLSRVTGQACREAVVGGRGQPECSLSPGLRNQVVWLLKNQEKEK